MHRLLVPYIVSLIVAMSVVGCASVEQREAAIRADHPQWDEQTVRDIVARIVTPGMTPEMVKAALGKPSEVTTGGPGREAWTYELGIWARDHPEWIPVYVVYFQDGKVSGTEGDRTRVPTWLRSP